MSIAPEDIVARILICLLLVVVSPRASPAGTGSSTVLGSTGAQRCYQASQVVLSMRGIKDCNAAIEEDNLPRRDLAATYSNRGLIFAGNGELEKALADHNKAVEILPTMPQAYINRGNVYHHMKRYEDALTNYRRAINLGTGPRHVPHYNAGLTLLKLKRVEEALEAFKNARELQPDSQRIQSKIDFIESLEDD